MSVVVESHREACVRGEFHLGARVAEELDDIFKVSTLLLFLMELEQSQSRPGRSWSWSWLFPSFLASFFGRVAEGLVSYLGHYTAPSSQLPELFTLGEIPAYLSEKTYRGA